MHWKGVRSRIRVLYRETLPSRRSIGWGTGRIVRFPILVVASTVLPDERSAETSSGGRFRSILQFAAAQDARESLTTPIKSAFFLALIEDGPVGPRRAPTYQTTCGILERRDDRDDLGHHVGPRWRSASSLLGGIYRH